MCYLGGKGQGGWIDALRNGQINDGWIDGWVNK